MVKQEVVVVTGASAGVGRAVARAFAAEHARVGLLARGSEGLEGARQDCERLGGVGLAIPTDVADASAVESAAARVENELGPIDIWVNNAMETVLAQFVDIPPDEFKRVTEVTYLGQVYGTMAALKRMVPRDTGVIVQVGSALAYRSIPLQSAYCGAKHAVKGFTDSIRSELMRMGSRVRITMVQLPAINTPQFLWARTRMERKPQPVPPIFQPEVPARAILHAARHPRRELFVGLSTMVVIWGNKLLPGVGDRYLARTGYDSQQYDGPVEPDRPDNLWGPVPADFGAHGPFDSRSHDRSPVLWLSLKRGWVATLAAAAGAAAVAFSLERKRLRGSGGTRAGFLSSGSKTK